MTNIRTLSAVLCVVCVALLPSSVTTASPDQPVQSASQPAPHPSVHLDPNRSAQGPLQVTQDDEDDEPDRPQFGWIEVYTAYGVDVKIDGKTYPRRSDYGLKVSAGQYHDVTVRSGEKEKVYRVFVSPKERVFVMADLTGYKERPVASPRPVKPVVSKSLKKEEPEKKEEETSGKLTVYAKPKGEVFIDGSPVGASTPMINRELDVGRHEVQVKWEGGKMSETKTVRIRKGSKLKLFFRDRGNKSK